MSHTEHDEEASSMKGLYRRGNVWWIALVRSPIDPTLHKPLSTGTDNDALARRIRDTVREWCKDGSERQREWIDRALRDTKGVKLLDLYNASKRGELDQLRAQLDAAVVLKNDSDLHEWVERWIKDVMPKRVTKRGAPLSDTQRADYARQLRALLPGEKPFPCSKFNEEYLTGRLTSLGVAQNTMRNYTIPWRLCIRWARRKGAPIVGDPFEFSEEWMPSPSKPRNKVWTHVERMAVLDQMTGSAKAAAALMLGTGMELSAVLRLRGKDVSHDGTRTVFADGRKTEYRSRHVTVDAWAWEMFSDNAPKAIGTAKVFPWKGRGSALRKAFYRAQVRAGLCEKPPMSGNGYEEWKKVEVHTIHDCRHTYAVCRGYGLDGEAKQDTDYIANQLGHANAEMATRVYKNLSAARRRQLIAEGERMHEAALDALTKAGAR